MSTTVTLTGALPFLVLVAALLAYPLSSLLLSLYRRSVQRGMASVAGGSATPAAAASRRQPVAALRIDLPPAARPAARQGPPSPLWQLATNGRWRAAAAYSAGGFAFAAIMTAGWLLATRDPAIVWIKLLVLFWTYCWPGVLPILLVAAYDRTRQSFVVGGYFAVLLALFAIALARNPGMAMHELPLHWILTNAPPTLLVLAFLARPIRAVGSLVLAFLIVAAIGSQALLSLAAANETWLRGIATFAFRLGLGANAVFVGMILAGMLAFAAGLGWPLLAWIGRRYEQKKTSDQSLMIDAQWLLFGLVQSIGLVFEGAAWIVTGLVAFTAFRLVSRAAMRRAVAAMGTAAARPQTLLLLRVFALGKRSERLFDRLRRHWQYVGNTTMIAGPDLVTGTIEPHEFLAFLSGRMARQFIRDAADLERRLATVDRTPDHDGRYRISEFFCHDDTWQMTMERLARDADAILMDLRSFSPDNGGCIFELGRLLDGIDLRRVLFLVDESTDRGFLEATLQELWQKLGADSPNQSALSPAARIFEVARQDERELAGLLQLLLGQEDSSGG